MPDDKGSSMQILIQTESRESTDILADIANVWLNENDYKTKITWPTASPPNMGRALGESVDESKFADTAVQKMFHPITVKIELDNSGAPQKALIDAAGPEDRPTS